MSKRTKRIICIIIAIILALALVIPAFADENPDKASSDSKVTKTETVTEEESYDEETNTKTKEVHVDVHIKEGEDEEEKKKSDYDEDDPVLPYEIINEPGREETAYDNYADFDALMQDKRGSTYYFDGKYEYDVVVEESGAEVEFVIHHLKNDDGEIEYFVYDGNDRRLCSGVRYTPEEMIITVYNVPAGQRIHIDAISKNYLDGVYITQSSRGTYQKGYDPLDSVLEIYGHFDSQEEVYRSLRYKDDVTVEELEHLLSTYPLIPSYSLLKKEGVAEAFIRAQEEYGVSALGLLSIACLESTYGTSHIAMDKQNLFGWGAVDSDPYNGAWDWSDMSTSDAIYKALSLICANYPCGKYSQDNFYTMRYNNGKHQYCTSTTWPYSNTRIRAQLEQYLGLR